MSEQQPAVGAVEVAAVLREHRWASDCRGNSGFCSRDGQAWPCLPYRLANQLAAAEAQLADLKQRIRNGQEPLPIDFPHDCRDAREYRAALAELDDLQATLKAAEAQRARLETALRDLRDDCVNHHSMDHPGQALGWWSVARANLLLAPPSAAPSGTDCLAVRVATGEGA